MTTPGVRFISATPSRGSCSGTSTVVCNLADFENGGSATIVIVIVPGPTVKLERAIHHLLNYYLDKLFGSDELARARRLREAAQALGESEAKQPAQDGGYSRSFRGAAE